MARPPDIGRRSVVGCGTAVSELLPSSAGIVALAGKEPLFTILIHKAENPQNIAKVVEGLLSLLASVVPEAAFPIGIAVSVIPTLAAQLPTGGEP